MKIEDIVSEWDKDCKIDETELDREATKIPKLHNKYLKIFMGERVVLFKLKAENKRIRKTLIEYYLGELDREELSEINRDQFYKKLLKNEVETYLEADDMYIENTLKVSVQGEKVAYVEAIVKSLNNRNFQIKSAIDWVRFTQGSM
jgi:hypothetical protein|tara:strand:- start:1185 stop:1622 length:438 start_codon:yes stop_codon:yes gene_type:complete